MRRTGSTCLQQLKVRNSGEVREYIIDNMDVLNQEIKKR
jgi:hypothetical protein